MQNLIEQFLEHLRYERNVSSHTLRNYSSDLEQFLDFLAPPDPATGKRTTPEVSAIDHLTIREWLASLHTAQKKKASIARKLAALRTFFQFLVREGMLELNPANRVAAPVYGPAAGALIEAYRMSQAGVSLSGVPEVEKQ